MARVHQYIRPLDIMTTKFDSSYIFTLNREETMIKQEPCDTDNEEVKKDHTLTNTQCKCVLTEDNRNQQDNVSSSIDNHNNYVTTGQIRIESISTKNNAVIENSQSVVKKRKRMFVEDICDEDGEILENSDNIKKSYKKRRNNVTKKHEVTQCDTCFLSCSNSRSLNNHKSYYNIGNTYFCNDCSSNSCYHIKEKNIKSGFKMKSPSCYFCERKFLSKIQLQAHIFHNHKEDLNAMNVEENNIIGNNHSTVPDSVISNKKKIRHKSLLKYISCFDKRKANKRKKKRTLKNSNDSTAMVKLEEELNNELIDKLLVDSIASNESQTNNTPNERRMNYRPFVKIHVDTNEIKALLKIPNDDLNEKSLYDNRIDSNINNDIDSNNSIVNKPYSLRSLNNSKTVNNNVTPFKPKKKNNQSNYKLRKLLNTCKNCIVIVKRCDNIVNATTSIRLTSNSLQLNTPSSQNSRSSINRKSKSVSNENDNNALSVSNNFNSQTSNLKDSITIDSSIQKSPIRVIRSRKIYNQSNLSVTPSIIDSKKNEKTECNGSVFTLKHQSIIDKMILNQHLKTSLKKNNIKNLEVSITKFNTEVLENKEEPIINKIKLKEVKIPLTRLPEIKKEPVDIENEIVPKEIFPCQYCDSLLKSEKSLKKHMKKYHTIYMSSICPAKYSSKRYLMKHYLKEHNIWTNKCCVCYQFLKRRLLLKQHLLLHCIEIIVSEIDHSVLNQKNVCNNLYKNLKSTSFKIIQRIPKSSNKHLNINNDDNINKVKLIKNRKIDNNYKNKREQMEEKNSTESKGIEIDNDENNQEKSTEPEEIHVDNDNTQENSTSPDKTHINNDRNKKNSTGSDEILINDDNNQQNSTEPKGIQIDNDKNNEEKSTEPEEILVDNDNNQENSTRPNEIHINNDRNKNNSIKSNKIQIDNDENDQEKSTEHEVIYIDNDSNQENSTGSEEIHINNVNNKQNSTEAEEIQIDNDENDQEKSIENEVIYIDNNSNQENLTEPEGIQIDNDENNQEKSTEPEEIQIDNDEDNQEKSTEPEEIFVDNDNNQENSTSPDEIHINNDNNKNSTEAEEIPIDNDTNDQEKSTENEVIYIDTDSNSENSTEAEEIHIDNDENNQKKSTENEVIYIIDDNIQDIPKNNFNINNAENVTNQISENKEKDDSNSLKIKNGSQPDRRVFVDLAETLKMNNIKVPISSKDDALKESTRRTVVFAKTFVPLNPLKDNLQTELTTNSNNTEQSSVNDSNDPKVVIENTIEKQKHPCPICGQQFQKLESLQQHKRTYDQSFNNCCENCGLFFSTKQTLKNHINATHNLEICNSYKLHCQFCNQGFRTQNNLRIHELHYHATAVTINNEKFTDFLGVSNGENSQTKTVCNVCGLFFNTYERYKLHCMYFYKDHIFPCTFCDKVFHGLYMIHRHNKLFHHPGNATFYTYKCIDCHEGFAFETHLNAHMLHVHPKSKAIESSLNSKNCNLTNKSYVCSKCNMEFSTIGELMIHVEHFSNRGTHKCSLCPRKCCTLSILREHTNLTHCNNEFSKKHKCRFCGEVLINNTFLLCHEKHVHDDLDIKEVDGSIVNGNPETDLPINGVYETVIDNEPTILLDSHSSSQVTVKECNFFCPICTVKFEKEINLKEHLAEYLDYGDYTCNDCQRRFANYDFLNRHIGNHLKQGMPRTEYYCTLCNENCQSSILLESHIAHLHARIIFKDL